MLIENNSDESEVIILRNCPNIMNYLVGLFLARRVCEGKSECVKDEVKLDEKLLISIEPPTCQTILIECVLGVCVCIYLTKAKNQTSIIVC